MEHALIADRYCMCAAICRGDCDIQRERKVFFAKLNDVFSVGSLQRAPGVLQFLF